MQNYDFARPSRPPAQRSPRHYQPNDYYHAGQQADSQGSNKLSWAYIGIILLIGVFCSGIFTGLWLAANNSSIGNLLGNFQSGKQSKKTAADMMNVSGNQPGSQNIPVKNQVLPQLSQDPQLSELNDKKQYLIYAGLFNTTLAHRLGYNLKKNNLPVLLVKSGEGLKLYVGSFDELKKTREALARMQKISAAYFENAVIRVHDSKGENSTG